MRQQSRHHRTRRGLVVLASAAAATLVGTSVQAAPSQGALQQEVDGPSGFSAVVLAPHSSFPDDVSAKFRLQYGGGRTQVSNLPRDAGTVVLAHVTWAPGGTSGWHTHPGPVVVTVTQGQVEVTNAGDCVPRTYGAGEAFLDPGQGNVHIATNPSDSADATAYATFLGVPDGEPATIWMPPADC